MKEALNSSIVDGPKFDENEEYKKQEILIHDVEELDYLWGFLNLYSNIVPFTTVIPPKVCGPDTSFKLKDVVAGGFDLYSYHQDQDMLHKVLNFDTQVLNKDTQIDSKFKQTSGYVQLDGTYFSAKEGGSLDNWKDWFNPLEEHEKALVNLPFNILTYTHTNGRKKEKGMVICGFRTSTQERLVPRLGTEDEDEDARRFQRLSIRLKIIRFTVSTSKLFKRHRGVKCLGYFWRSSIKLQKPWGV